MISAIAAKAQALVATWFLGVEAGNAIADVLTGTFNPPAASRHLARDVGQVPIFFAERPSGRPADPDNHYTSKYLDMPIEPLFRWTRIELQPLRLEQTRITRRISSAATN